MLEMYSCKCIESTTRQRNLENEAFTLKTHQMFSVHTMPQEFQKATITSNFGFVFEEISDRESNDNHDVIVFLRASFFK